MVCCRSIENAHSYGRFVTSLALEYLDSIGSVIDGLELRGCNRLPIVSSKEFDLFSGALAAFREEMNRSPENRLLKEV